MHNSKEDTCYCDICKTEIPFPSSIDCTRVLHNCDVKEPGLLEKAKNYAAGMAQHAATGFKKASEATIVERKEICSRCDYNVKNKCLRCGCSILKKIKWSSQSCPEEKW